MISRTVLVAPECFAAELDARRAAGAIGRGLCAADATLAVDLCPLEALHEDRSEMLSALHALNFDGRMRAARAVVVGAGRLDEQLLLGSVTFEIATRARQAGVPAYAVAAVNALDLFDARILDLQVILQAGNTRALRRAGEQLAGLV